jgi:hypothetical protein
MYVCMPIKMIGQHRLYASLVILTRIQLIVVVQCVIALHRGLYDYGKGSDQCPILGWH